MPKATVQQMKDEGWRVDQFGGALSPSQFDAYLGDLLAEAGRWTAHHVGAEYALTPSPGYVADLLARAELAFCASRLWKRRASFFDAAGTHELESPAYAERREYLAHAERMMACAESALADALSALGLPTDGLGADWAGMASGMVETGPYPPVTQVAA